MRVVLDASVAVKWFLDDEDSFRRRESSLKPSASIKSLSAAMQLSLKHAGGFYDAIYVALAIREDVQVVTGDRSMCNAFAKVSRCIHIADFKL